MSAVILRFPQTQRAIRHYETGMNAAGLLSLLLLDREGETTPANVERIDGSDNAALPAQSLRPGGIRA